MEDVRSAGGSVEQPKLSPGAAASPPQVKKRSSVRSRSHIQPPEIVLIDGCRETQLVKPLSERTSLKRPRRQRPFASSLATSILTRSPTPLQARPTSSRQATTSSGIVAGDEKLTSYEAKRTKRAMRAIRALQGFGSEESEGEEELMSPPILANRLLSHQRSINDDFSIF